ncbi:hypothetical protein NDU88_001382, partial [Pleurodeles waltl]
TLESDSVLKWHVSRNNPYMEIQTSQKRAVNVRPAFVINPTSLNKRKFTMDKNLM